MVDDSEGSRLRGVCRVGWVGDGRGRGEFSCFCVFWTGNSGFSFWVIRVRRNLFSFCFFWIRFGGGDDWLRGFGLFFVILGLEFGIGS